MILFIILLALFPVLLCLYVVAFMFLHGDGPKGTKHDKWINTVCAPEGIFETVKSWGYVKASWTRFYNVYRLKLFPQDSAEVGKRAPEAKLISLEGKELSLLRDYVQKVPKGMPLVLNMGSYT